MRITRAAVKAGLALLASTVALVGMTTTASAATGADGFTILDASAGNQAHVCHILGTDDDYHEAIVCVDINTKVSGDQVLIQGQLEAYCQDDNGTVVQCANIMDGGKSPALAASGRHTPPTAAIRSEHARQGGSTPTVPGWVTAPRQGKAAVHRTHPRPSGRSRSAWPRRSNFPGQTILTP